MNISNVSSATTYPPQAATSARPAPRADHDGDSDDRAGAVSSAAAPAQAEATEAGKLNVKA